MQDLENAGFKLFTQMHRGQQKGWRKYGRADCRAAAFRRAIRDHVCPSSAKPYLPRLYCLDLRKTNEGKKQYLECDRFRAFWDLDDIIGD